MTKLGVDIGGTKIQFCRVDDKFQPVPLGRTPTALMRRGTSAFASDLAELIRSIMPPGTRGIGVSLNGVLDRGHVVYSSLMGGMVDFPLERFLRDTLNQDVVVDDDIHAMALAEARLGSGREGEPLALLNIGTGIGVGFHGGEVLRGRFAAGLISEQKIYVEELGEYRSLDRTVCGRGIREIYQTLGNRDVDAINVFRLALEGDPVAHQTISIFAKGLGYALKLISHFYHPARIVINGSIKHATAQYLDESLAVYREGLSRIFEAEITISELDHAAELGTLLVRREA